MRGIGADITTIIIITIITGSGAVRRLRGGRKPPRPPRSSCIAHPKAIDECVVVTQVDRAICGCDRGRGRSSSDDGSCDDDDVYCQRSGQSINHQEQALPGGTAPSQPAQPRVGSQPRSPRPTAV